MNMDFTGAKSYYLPALADGNHMKYALFLQIIVTRFQAVQKTSTSHI